MQQLGRATWSLLSAAALVITVAAACGPGETEEPQSPTGSPSTSAEPSSAPPADEEPNDSVRPVTYSAEVRGSAVTALVGPVTVKDGAAVLRLEFSSADSIMLGDYFSDPYVSGAYAPTAVQLIDFSAATVADIAWDSSGVAASANPGQLGVEPVVYYAAYAVPSADSVAVLMPGFGLIPNVPVVPEQEAEEFTTPLADLTDSPAQSLTYPLAHLETFTEELDGALHTRADQDGTRVTLDADVLFAVDSAELTKTSEPALKRAAKQLGSVDGGDLHIVGHTDDVGTHEHNQDLSERRAQSVAKRLEALQDLSAFDVTVEGRSFDEPAVPRKDAEARAANRRVEIAFAATATSLAPEDVEAPETTGPVASGVAGVDLVGMSHQFHASLDEVHRVGDYLVGEIELTNTGETDAALISIFSGAVHNSRGQLDVTLQSSASQLTLLNGGTRVYPVDYITPERDYVMSGGERKPLADRVLRNLPTGATRTVIVVWPGFDANTVTLDSPALTSTSGNSDRGGPPFRLTDIPVTDLP